MRLRLATLADAEAIRAIYNVEIETSTATFDLVPRTLADQEAWLAARSGAFSAIVAEVDGTVAGFAALSPYKDRPAYSPTVEDSVYVAASHQGQGLGSALLTEICTIARDSGFHSVIARIESTREASIGLHRSCGFELVGTEQEVGRKFGRWLGVTIMQRLPA